MRVRPQDQPSDQLENTPSWSRSTRLAFRFTFLYLGLYCLSTQIAGSLIAIPSVPFNGIGLLWPMREITLWVGAHVLRLDAPLSFTGNSRDTDFYWVQMLWLLIVSILGTLVWWITDN